MKILLLSAYDAMSHRYWHTGLVEAFPEHEWTVLTLPDHHFFWRVRSNSMTWAFEQRPKLTQPYDLCWVTSMVDLASLRGFVPELAQVPTIAYFHENQFAYPLQHPSLQVMALPQSISLYTALAADQICFNSAYNQQSFLDGVRMLSKKMVDGIPDNLASMIQQKASVLPVPLKGDPPALTPQTLKPIPEIVWNHRWEYDKAPEVFFGALQILKSQGIAFKLHVVGQQFKRQPDVFEQAKDWFADEIQTWGFVDHAQYQQILASSDFVVSTAIHDFQGIAMLEATAAGCHPIAPNRLAYPEFFSESFLYPSTPDDPEAEKAQCAQLIQKRLQDYQKTPYVPPNVAHLFWKHKKRDYSKIWRN